MEAIARLITVLLIPIGFINVLGGIVSGIWLAILGHWGAIGYGLLFLAFSSFGLGLAMMPGLIFAAPAAMMVEKGSKIGGYFFGLLSTLYTYGVLTAWCLAILAYYLKDADQDSIIPLLIWSYGVATGPIGWMAQKERNEYSMISTFFVQLAYLIGIVAILFVGVSMSDLISIFGVVMLAGLIVQFSLAYMTEKASGYYD
jgi:hypothetical protein